MNKICLRCEHEWITRMEEPKACPRCKSHLWNVPYNTICNLCGKKVFIPILHHIDGNHSNNIINNRILICSKCHRLLHTPGKNNKNLKNEEKLLENHKFKKDSTFEQINNNFFQKKEYLKKITNLKEKIGVKEVLK